MLHSLHSFVFVNNRSDFCITEIWLLKMTHRKIVSAAAKANFPEYTRQDMCRIGKRKIKLSVICDTQLAVRIRTTKSSWQRPDV